MTNRPTKAEVNKEARAIVRALARVPVVKRDEYGIKLPLGGWLDGEKHWLRILVLVLRARKLAPFLKGEKA